MNENSTARLLLGIIGGVVVTYLLNWLKYTIFGQMTSVSMLYNWGDRNQLVKTLLLLGLPSIIGGFFASVITRSLQFSFVGGVLAVIVNYIILWGSILTSGVTFEQIFSNNQIFVVMLESLLAIPLFVIGGAVWVYVWPKFLSLSENAK